MLWAVARSVFRRTSAACSGSSPRHTDSHARAYVHLSLLPPPLHPVEGLTIYGCREAHKASDRPLTLSPLSGPSYPARSPVSPPQPYAPPPPSALSCPDLPFSPSCVQLSSPRLGDRNGQVLIPSVCGPMGRCTHDLALVMQVPVWIHR